MRIVHRRSFPQLNIEHPRLRHLQDAPGKRPVCREGTARIPAGFELVSHSHAYDHLSVLASGTVLWSSGGQTVRRLRGPCASVTVESRASSIRCATQVTDAVWYCIHPTDEADPAKVDAVILQGA